MPKSLNRDYTRKGTEKVVRCGNRGIIHEVRSNSLKRRNRSQLTSKEIRAIVNHILVHKWSHAEVAIHFKVKTNLVNRL